MIAEAMRCGTRGSAVTSVVLTTAGVLWAVGVLAGLKVMWSYETMPGESAQPPVEWPADSRIERVAGRPTLIMLAHPRCSCTRASLVELNAIMAEVPGAVTAY